MSTAIIGTEGVGSAIGRQLASSGELLRLASADNESARKPAAAIGGVASDAVDNRTALQGADGVVLALRFSVLEDAFDEIAGALSETPLVVPSNPVGFDAKSEAVRLLSEGGGDLHHLVVGSEEALFLIVRAGTPADMAGQAGKTNLVG